MKIAIIGPTAPYKGGISHYNTLLCKNLSKRHKIELISWKRRYPKFFFPAEQLDKKSKKKISSDARFILDYLNPFSWLRAFFIVKKEKPKLLIFHWVTPFFSPVFTIISFLTKHFTKTKILLICHNVLPHERRFFDKFLTKLFFNNVDSFIVHSREDLENLKRLKKDINVKVGFLATFSFFNVKKYDVKKIKKDLKLKEKVILFFGFVRKYKGLEYLIRAMPLILREINLDLLIVGEFWDDKKYYTDLIGSLGIGKNVKIIDRYVPDEEVGKYFSIVDIVVMPYVSATQSGIIQIAYRVNKPVITTNVGGLPDVVRDGKTGFIVRPKSYIDIAKAVIRFYKKGKKKEFIENIIKEKDRFSWEKYVKLVEGFVGE